MSDGLRDSSRCFVTRADGGDASPRPSLLGFALTARKLGIRRRKLPDRFVVRQARDGLFESFEVIRRQQDRSQSQK